MDDKTLFRLVLMVTLGCIISLRLNAQSEHQPDVSASIQQLQNARDTARIDLLLNISEELKTSNPREAYTYAREAFDLSDKLNDAGRTALACRLLAGIYTVTAVYEKALEYLLMAFEYFERSDDTLQMALCYNDIGIVHMLSGDFAEAQNSYRQALMLNKAMENHALIARNYMNMGENYLNADSVDKGLSYLLVSYMIADSLGMEQEKVALLKNIGLAYTRLGRYEEALGHLFRALELLDEKPDDLIRAEALVNMATGYYRLKNYPAALTYAREGYELARTKHFDHVYRDALAVLSDIYAAQGFYRLAYQFSKEYSAMSDTIMNTEKAEQLARIQTMYDVNLKEAENITLREQNLLANKRMHTRALVIIVITLLVLALAALVYFLVRMNDRLALLNKKLAKQSEELKALNDMKDKFFSFVAHNLKNPFNTIMGFSELMQRAADTNDVAKVKQYSGLVYDLSTQVQKVLSNLLEWSRLQRRTFEVKAETLELTGLIKDVVEMNNKEMVRKDISMTIPDCDTVFVVADRSMITTVLQNLVINAITFTPAGGSISIDCRVKDQYSEVTVADTGVGIPEEMLARLFDFDFSKQKTGLPEHGGTGLGLVICKEMLTKNNGIIRAESQPGKGSRFTFTLPVAKDQDTDNTSKVQQLRHTPLEVADELVSSQVAISQPLSEELKESLKPRFEEVSRVLSIDNLEDFARALTMTGEKYGNTPLLNYGRSLLSLTHGHQIDQILRILPRFNEFLAKATNS